MQNWRRDVEAVLNKEFYEQTMLDSIKLERACEHESSTKGVMPAAHLLSFNKY